MLDDNPVLKERLMAFGAFSGIALFAVAAVDVMVTGGFDFAAHRAPYNRGQPSAYVRVVEAAQYVNDRFREAASDQPMVIDTAAAAATEALVGENDGSPSPEPAERVSGDALSMEIEALYAQQQDAGYADEGLSEEPVYREEISPEEAEKLASASGSASPW